MNIIMAIFMLGSLICEIFAIYWLFRAIMLLERYIALESNNNGQQQSDNPQSKFVEVGSIQEIGDIPPDVIAPCIKNPPRPAGGFGSRVSENDGSTQFYERNQDSIGRDEGSPIADESGDSCSIKEEESPGKTEADIKRTGRTFRHRRK